jgi:hypothetical protein
MAFGGVGTQTSVDQATVVDLGRTLGARNGAFNIANADSGQFTTAAIAANQTALPVTWGPGRGNWVALDANLVDIEVQDLNAGAQGGAGETSLVYLSGLVVTAGDLVVSIHNHGAQATTGIRLRFVYHSISKLGTISR